MSERSYLILVGAVIIVALYFVQNIIIYGLCFWLIVEGMTDIRLTTLIQKARHITISAGLTVFKHQQRFSFDAFRAWRLTVAFVLGSAMLLLQNYSMDVLWFLPWFMGFAIMGAGVSGICPMLLFLRWIGFR